MRRLTSWYSRAELVVASFYPTADLIVRLWLGGMLFAASLDKAVNQVSTYYPLTHAYPDSWIVPLAAIAGVVTAYLGPIMLLLGLGTRLAAISLLIVFLTIQPAHIGFPENLYWITLLGWYLIIGAGPASIDHALSRGIQACAVPVARPIYRVFSLTTQKLGPIYLLLLRCGVATLVLRYVPLVLPLGFAVALGSFTRFAALPLMLAAMLAVPAGGDGYLWLAVLLLLIATRGPGPLALDQLMSRCMPSPSGKTAELPHVVIVGAGFGGIAATQGLRGVACRVTLIDRHNYHLFQPLLYQVATAGLSPADIATPIRSLFRDQPNVQVLFGEVDGVDHVARTVSMGESTISYDYLVLATGARNSYFGRDEWAEFAPVLKRIEDATAIRRRLLLAFELAENSTNVEERAALLTFVVVGGGPTGVELAGAIAELTNLGMTNEFRTIDPTAARVLLVEAAPRILAQFDESLSEAAKRSLAELGVEVMTGGRVEHIEANGVTISGQFVPSRTVMWAAGVVASPAANWLGVEADRAGRVKVGADLSIPGHPNIFAIGDTVASDAWAGKPVPGLAPAAKQGGAYVAKLIRARIDGGTVPGPFAYRHYGSLATIGRSAAVAEFGRIRLKGAVAWWLWGAVHIAFLDGVRNRTVVAFGWFWAYMTFRRGTRLITDSAQS